MLNNVCLKILKSKKSLQWTKENLKKTKELANVASEIKGDTASMKQEQVVRMEHSENKKEHSEVKNKSSERLEGWKILPENTPKKTKTWKISRWVRKAQPLNNEFEDRK